MALNGLICAEVPLRIYSLNHSHHITAAIVHMNYIAYWPVDRSASAASRAPPLAGLSETTTPSS